MRTLVIGIDGGGTKTRVVALDSEASESAIPIAAVSAGPCNIAAVSVSDALANVGDGIAKLGVDTGAVRGVCAGIAGYSFEERRLAFWEGLASVCPNAKVDVVADYVVAHYGALAGGHGITAIAGTGSVAFGRNAAGQEAKAGGYGYLIDDAGSGYGVGRRAIAAVLAELDGSGAQTALSALLKAELGSVDSAYLIASVYGGLLDRVRIASLSRPVAQGAEKGDAVCREILRATGMAQADSVTAVAGRLYPNNEDVPVRLCGGLWQAGTALIAPFRVALQMTCPTANVETASQDAGVGAAVYARDRYNGMPV